MKNMSISTKLITGFGAVLILLILALIISMVNMSGIVGQVELYSRFTVPNMDSNWSMRRDLVSAQRYLLRAFIQNDTATIKKELAQAEADGKTVLETLEKYAKNQRNTNRDARIKEVRAYQEQAGEIRRSIAALLETPSEENLQKAEDKFENEYLPIFDKMSSILIEFTAEATKNAQQQDITSQQLSNTSNIMFVLTGIISVLLTVVIALIIRKSILTPVKEIESVYAEMAKGNMQAQLTYEGRDELGSMAKSIRKTNNMLAGYINDISQKLGQMSKGDMRVKVDMDYIGDFAAIRGSMEATANALSETLQNINTAAEQVSTGASQVANGAQALAAGSTEQASSVEELSSSITLIAQQAAENSTNVQLAAQYVKMAGDGVTASNEQMAKLSSAMQNIGTSSEQIANITKVIEDIAFQTNILALNAAIEAARAGNAGKGFAVVADEVRNLAAKSAEAAKKTADLIQHSTATVHDGTNIAQQAVLTLQDVMGKAAKVEESIVNIERSSNEQAMAIEQVRLGLTQVSAVVQTNAATAEENSATSEEMSAQAVTLREEVSKFRLNTGRGRGDGFSISLLKEPAAPKAKANTAGGFGKY